MFLGFGVELVYQRLMAAMHAIKGTDSQNGWLVQLSLRKVLKYTHGLYLKYFFGLPDILICLGQLEDCQKISGG